MTYSPGSPGASGYQPGSYGAPAPSFTPVAEPGPSKLPQYLNIAVVVLGVLAYVAAFGPRFTLNQRLGPVTVQAVQTGGFLLTLASVLAALIAGIGLLLKSKNYGVAVAVLSLVGVFTVFEQLINRPSLPGPAPVRLSPAWGLWVVLVLVILQAIAAVLALLYEHGVLTPPAPKPRYETQYGQYNQYGQYGGPAGPGAPGGGYYNQPGPQAGQRPGYPSQYSGYGQGPSAGGYGGPGNQGAHAAPQGPPTPPTGYPSFSPPPAVGSGAHHADTDPNLGSVIQSSPLSSESATSGSTTYTPSSTPTTSTPYTPSSSDPSSSNPSSTDSGSSGSTGSSSY